MGRTPPHPEVSQFDLQQVLEALVDPVRRSIVTQLDAAGRDIACGGFERRSAGRPPRTTPRCCAWGA
ncbi:hypothetical protein ACIBBD_19955 [Streptomyces sp. NPDC051315]|uniref:hypothetical protein n=1 Tax=Streptomyces sp. NPDC051315 TaxID=3365650 RepID=UPI00378EAD72